MDSTPLVPADLSFVSVKDFAAFIFKSDGLSDADTKARITESLGAATEAVEAVVGPLDASEHTYRLMPQGPGGLVLPDSHLQSVTSVTDPSGNPVSLDHALVDLDAGVIVFGHHLGRGLYTVVATTREHGYSVKMAIKIIASHLYDVNRGQIVTYPEGMVNPVDDPVAHRTGFAIPRRAADLLRPFLRGQ